MRSKILSAVLLPLVLASIAGTNGTQPDCRGSSVDPSLQGTWERWEKVSD